jgi:hypothetical protein
MQYMSLLTIQDVEKNISFSGQYVAFESMNKIQGMKLSLLLNIMHIQSL